MDEVFFIVQLAFMTSILPNKRISYLRILSIFSILLQQIPVLLTIEI